MNYKSLFLFLAVISINLSVFPHPWKPDYNLIIETNGSEDDLLVIEKLFKVTNIKVCAILLSGNKGNEKKQADIMRGFLSETNHQGLLYGVQGFVESELSVDGVIENLLKHCDSKIYCLGLSGLSVIESVIKTDAVFANKVADVYHFKEEGGLPVLYSKFEVDVKKTDEASTQIFKSFPLQDHLYIEDIGLKKDEVISRFGIEEWAAVVLTNELHRHVGIYSIIGAKMGIRALEYFGAGVDELLVESFAGSKPPVSCMNDGIQVSTGATIGHGLIHVSDDSLQMPQATFTYWGKTISIRLKDEYRQKAYKEIHQLKLVYGLKSDMYWDLLREFAIRSWFNWNRNDIFEIQKVN